MMNAEAFILHGNNIMKWPLCVLLVTQIVPIVADFDPIDFPFSRHLDVLLHDLVTPWSRNIKARTFPTVLTFGMRLGSCAADEMHVKFPSNTIIISFDFAASRL